MASFSNIFAFTSVPDITIMKARQSWDVEASPRWSTMTTVQEGRERQQNPTDSDQEPEITLKRRLTRLWHKPGPRMVSDSILGLSDGLTVPFALTAGLASLGNTRIVILGGLAELIAGAISMGLGGYVGAKSEFESYDATERKCDDLLRNSRSETKDIVQDYFQSLQIGDYIARRVSHEICSSPVNLKNFLMQHHFEAVRPDVSRPYISAITLGISYFAGGFIPLLPYFFVPHQRVIDGLWWSIGVMGVVLLVFGYVKTGVVRGWKGQDNLVASIKGALQMLIVGALAAGAAVGLVRAINSSQPM